MRRPKRKGILGTRQDNPFGQRDKTGYAQTTQYGIADAIGAVNVDSSMGISGAGIHTETLSGTATTRIKIKHVYFSYKITFIDATVSSLLLKVSLGNTVIFQRYLNLTQGSNEQFVWDFENVILYQGEAFAMTIVTNNFGAADDVTINLSGGAVGIVV